MGGLAAQLERARKERTALAMGMAAVAMQAVGQGYGEPGGMRETLGTV